MAKILQYFLNFQQGFFSGEQTNLVSYRIFRLFANLFRKNEHFLQNKFEADLRRVISNRGFML